MKFNERIGWVVVFAVLLGVANAGFQWPGVARENCADGRCSPVTAVSATPLPCEDPAVCPADAENPVPDLEYHCREEIAPEFSDTVVILREMERAVGELVEKDAIVAFADLKEGLKKNRAPLRLPAARTRPMSPSEIYASCHDSVVVVGAYYKCGNCPRHHVSAASGFILTEDGAIATNYHVINRDEGVTMIVRLSDGRILPVKEVLGGSRQDDVAILRVEGDNLKPLPIRSAAPVGTEVVVISHPDQRFYTLTEGLISRYFMKRGRGDRPGRVAITADYARGSSGAPVIDEQGNAVAVVAATSPIYYDRSDSSDDSKGNTLQMVVKSCVPAEALAELTERE